MASDRAVNGQDKLQSQVRFHRAMNVGLLDTLFFRVLLLGFVVVRDATKIVPSEARWPYGTGSNYANRSYLLDMTGYILGTVLTVTPGTIDYDGKAILKVTGPDGYTELGITLDVTAMWLEQERVTTIWIPRKEGVSGQDKRVEVSGKLKIFIADKLAPEHEEDYLIEFTITTSGCLYVSKTKEVTRRDSSANKPAGN